MNSHALAFALLACASAASAQDLPHGVGREFTAAEYAEHNANLASFEKYDAPPKLVKGYVPLYPISRLMSRRTGRCIVEYSIETDGRTSEVTGSPGDDKKMCDHAVLAVKRWTFTPAVKDGKPARLRLRVPISYDFK